LIKEVIILGESYLKTIEKFDPELFKNVEATQDLYLEMGFVQKG